MGEQIGDTGGRFVADHVFGPVAVVREGEPEIDEVAMNISIVYMTAGSIEEAQRIAKALVQQQLAACVNIIEGMRSVYEWHGILQEDHEVVMIAKTRSDRLTDLMDVVKALHSYACPCILEFKVGDGNTAFLNWIDTQVGTKSPESQRIDRS